MNLLPDVETPVQVETLRPGLAVVRLPLPMRVEPVNCYVAIDPDGVASILDTGIAAGARELWQMALAQLGIEPEQVRRIIVSHFHPDHIGGAAPLATLTDAPVAVSEVTARQAPLVWDDPHREGAFERINQMLVAHGFPSEMLVELRGEVAVAGVGVRLPARFERLPADGAVIDFGGEAWEVLATPGHADGHICLYNRARRELLGGDHLLERISPAVGRFPDHHPDPLGMYLDSLARVATLDIDVVYPGHGAPFRSSRARCDWLLQHHEQRVDACLAALTQGPAPAREIALAVFGAKHDAANQRFALTETIAHLDYARRRGRARLQEHPDKGGVLRYALAPAAGVG